MALRDLTRPSRDLLGNRSCLSVLGLVLGATTGCGSLCEEEAPRCDVLQRSCQETLLEAVTCLRGDGADALPPVRTVTPDALAGELGPGTMDGMGMMMSVTDDFDRALALLGLLPEATSTRDAVTASRSGVTAAFYSSIDKEIGIVVQPGGRTDSEQAVRSLVHELVHAIQDAESDLYGRGRNLRSHEDAFRYISSVEGEATMIALFFSAWQAGADPLAARWTPTLEGLESSITGLLGVHPGYVWGLHLSTYLYGTRWQHDRWAAGIDLRQAVRRGEPATATVLLENGFNPAHTATPRAELGCPRPSAPAGFEVADEDVMGPSFLVAFLRGKGVPYGGAWIQSLDLAADALVSYGDGRDRTVVLWRLRFGSSSTRNEVQDRLANTPGIELVDGGDTLLTVHAATAGVDLSTWTWDGDADCARR